MKAIVLSAGFGTRIRPLSNHLPKILLPILGRPLIDNILLYLRKFGVNEVALNTHHLARVISDYLKNGVKYKLKISLSHESQILGTGGGIGNLRDFLITPPVAENFIVHNGDTLTNLDLSPALDLHNKTNATATLILHNYPSLNMIEISSDGRILDIGKLQPKDSTRLAQIDHNYAYTGVSIMNQRIFEYLPGNDYGNLTDVFRELIKRKELFGYLTSNHYWREIGTAFDYLKAHRDILVERTQVLMESELPPFSIFTGQGSRISRTAQLKGFVSIGRDCIIEDGVSLEDSVVWDDVILSENEKGKDTVFGKGWRCSV
jgi:NDP-sugar pyrophosphorylase family protein